MFLHHIHLHFALLKYSAKYTTAIKVTQSLELLVLQLQFHINIAKYTF